MRLWGNGVGFSTCDALIHRYERTAAWLGCDDGLQQRPMFDWLGDRWAPCSLTTPLPSLSLLMNARPLCQMAEADVCFYLAEVGH